MVSLTVQQREILQYLLQVDTSTTLAEIGATMNLTPRQVNYRLKGVRAWLEQRNVFLGSKPGIGYEINCSVSQRRSLLKELDTRSNFDLVLSADERQQLLALKLLTSDEPLILRQVQQLMVTSRATASKDIDTVETWLSHFDVQLDRRPNYGFSIRNKELARRQAIIALLWGNTPFSDSLFKITYDEGLLFSLADVAEFSPIVQRVYEQLQQWDVNLAFEWVAQAEAEMHGRFADNAVLHMALAFAVQRERVRTGNMCHCTEENLHWLKAQPVWSIATRLANSMWPDMERSIPETESAVIAMHLVVGLRNEEWPGDLYTTPGFTSLVDMLVENVAQAFFEPELVHDLALREGLAAHVVPALMRQRFNIWAPPSWSDEEIAQNCHRERKIAQTLAALVKEHTGIALPTGEIDTITLLLRAAYIRARPARQWQVFVICPTGMATAQLLAARLKTRFPNLEILGVLSQRELSSERVTEAQILITTTPIDPPISNVYVIQVHPLLLPQDLAAISKWVSS